MREKLIQILQNECHNFGVSDQGYDAEFIHHTMFNVNRYFRCDKCKHWGTDAACSALQGENPLADIHDDYVSRANVFTQPEFFCALWEAK